MGLAPNSHLCIAARMLHCSTFRELQPAAATVRLSA